jgi:hypothetical protein
VVNTFVTYELRQPADLIADAIEMYVMTKAAQGNSRAVMCLARYDVNQPPAGSS